jgi:hypothetical protein
VVLLPTSSLLALSTIPNGGEREAESDTSSGSSTSSSNNRIGIVPVLAKFLLGVGNAVPNSNSERQALTASNVATELEMFTDDAFRILGDRKFEDNLTNKTPG